MSTKGYSGEKGTSAVTEILLNAILHLFAIQSAMAPPSSRGLVREKVAAYLGDHLGLEDLRPYLDLFDMTLEMHGESPGRISGGMSGRWPKGCVRACPVGSSS